MVRVHASSSLSSGYGLPGSVAQSASVHGYYGLGVVPQLQRRMAQPPHQVPMTIDASTYSPQVDQHTTEYLPLTEQFPPSRYQPQSGAAYQSVWDIQYQPNSPSTSPETPISAMDTYSEQTGHFPDESGIRASLQHLVSSGGQAGGSSYSPTTATPGRPQGSAMPELMACEVSLERDPVFDDDDAEFSFRKPVPGPPGLYPSMPGGPAGATYSSQQQQQQQQSYAFPSPGLHSSRTRQPFAAPYADHVFSHAGHHHHHPTVPNAAPHFRYGWPAGSRNNNNSNNSNNNNSNNNNTYIPDFSARCMFTGKRFEDLAPRGQKRCNEFREQYERSAKRGRTTGDHVFHLDGGGSSSTSGSSPYAAAAAAAASDFERRFPEYDDEYAVAAAAARVRRGKTTVEVEVYDVSTPGVEALLRAPGAGTATTTATMEAATMEATTTTTFLVVGNQTIEVICDSDCDPDSDATDE